MTGIVRLPTPVSDYQWDASFDPDASAPNAVTTHKQYTRRQEKWVRVGILGRGGYGLVWLERKQRKDAVVELRAVKQLDISHAVEKDGRYVRELEALAKFTCGKYDGSFVELKCWYESPKQDQLFVATEYCEHGDLGRYLRENGPLLEHDAQDIAAQVLQGIMFMHESGFTHRDLKPANILIVRRPPESWAVKLCDLGLSKRIVDDAMSTVRGTRDFMPPELLGFVPDSPPFDAFQGDMWCFGEIAYRLLVNKRAFPSEMDLYRYRLGQVSFPVASLQDSGVSSAGVHFITSLLLADPRERMDPTTATNHAWLSFDVDLLQDPSGDAQQAQVIRDKVRLGSDEITQPSGSWTRPAFQNLISSSSDSDSFSLTAPSGTWTTKGARDLQPPSAPPTNRAEAVDIGQDKLVADRTRLTASTPNVASATPHLTTTSKPARLHSPSILHDSDQSNLRFSRPDSEPDGQHFSNHLVSSTPSTHVNPSHDRSILDMQDSLQPLMKSEYPLRIGDLKIHAPVKSGTAKEKAHIPATRPDAQQRTLQKWKVLDDVAGYEQSLEGSIGDWDQFAVHERMTGSQSIFDESHYTTVLDTTSPDYAERVRRAEQIAREIEATSGIDANANTEVPTNIRTLQATPSYANVNGSRLTSQKNEKEASQVGANTQHDRASKLSDLKKFAQNFKLHTDPPLVAQGASNPDHPVADVSGLKPKTTDTPHFEATSTMDSLSNDKLQSEAPKTTASARRRAKRRAKNAQRLSDATGRII